MRDIIELAIAQLESFNRDQPRWMLIDAKDKSFRQYLKNRAMINRIKK